MKACLQWINRSVPEKINFFRQHQHIILTSNTQYDQVQLEQAEVTSSNITPPTYNNKPSYGPRPNTNATNFDFEAEINYLPFKLNMETEAKMMHAQLSLFLNIIYDYLEVFSLHDEDLGFCNKIKHKIPMTLDKPVYLPHHTIPPQLQGEVHKYLDTWLRQSIIKPSQSPYASQVVLVQKRQGNLSVCEITKT